jgi:protein-tyrosine phosphatase
MSFVEIHFHLLPGVDDGPSSIEDTVELAAAAWAEGTRTIVTTPHVRADCTADLRDLPAVAHDVAARLKREHIGIEVQLGAELAHEMVGRLSQRELESIAQGPPGGRWLLVELPFAGVDDGFTAATEELRNRGFAVVVAHPERAFGSSDAAWPAVEHELAAGSALQLNAWSIAGLYGERVRSAALRMLHAAPRAAIASDAHGGDRMPALRLALDALTAAGEPNPERLAGAVPRSLLEHGLPAAPTAAAA